MKTQLRVKGMHCRSCEMIIEESLSEMDGVKGVKANQKEGKVDVEYDEKSTGLEKIKAAIKKEGYEAA